MTVVYITVTRKLLRERYIMLASISIAHILFCIGVPPLVISHHVTDDVSVSRASEFLCCCVVCVASLTMSVTAVRRVLAISEKFRYKIGAFSFETKVKFIVIVWIISVVLSAPFLFFGCKRISPFSPIIYRCGTLVATDGNNKAKIGAEANATNNDLVNDSIACSDMKKGIIQNSESKCYIYSIVLALMIVFICSFVSMTLQMKCWFDITKRPNQKLWIKETMATKQHLVMLALFEICWTPLTIINLLQLNINLNCGLQYACKSLAMSSAVYNPIVYYFFNINMKQDIQKRLKNILRKDRYKSDTFHM